MIRTRFAPSPTGYMHIGNLRTALYEYLIAKSQNGKFILRIEDTDEQRYVEGATQIIFNSLKLAGLSYDEGPDIGGDFGPYVQSHRKNIYLKYAKMLIDKGNAYYCFCTKERLSKIKELPTTEDVIKYDRHCLFLPKEEIEKNLEQGVPYVIRQIMPTEGTTSFTDTVFGAITVENSQLDDQILIKSDGLPTYNFANVVDDHLMNITHVVRGSEYLSSTPKYNLLYDAFGWDKPTYIHLPPVMKSSTEKLSKRNGDASFEDLIKMGYLPEAVINYIALLGWSPSYNEEFFTLEELTEKFNIEGLSKSPAIFDMTKLTWMNSEYFKRMDLHNLNELLQPRLKKYITNDNIEYIKISKLLQTRLQTLNDIPQWIDFFEALPEYDIDIYTHKKMKTNASISLSSLISVLPMLEETKDWSENSLHDSIMNLVKQLGIKNGQMLWPIRTALSGKAASAGGAIELLDIFGKEESIRRIKIGIEKLEKYHS